MCIRDSFKGKLTQINKSIFEFFKTILFCEFEAWAQGGLQLTALYDMDSNVSVKGAQGAAPFSRGHSDIEVQFQQTT